jgi:hypothetical protein
LITDSVLTATQSIDGGTPGSQANATGMRHEGAALQLSVYDCEIRPIKQLLII